MAQSPLSCMRGTEKARGGVAWGGRPERADAAHRAWARNGVPVGTVGKSQTGGRPGRPPERRARDWQISAGAGAHRAAWARRGDVPRVSLLPLSPEQYAVSDHRPPAPPLAICASRFPHSKTRETPTHAESLSLSPG